MIDAKDAYTRKRKFCERQPSRTISSYFQTSKIYRDTSTKVNRHAFDIEGLKFVCLTGIHQATNGDNENCTLVYEKLKNLRYARRSSRRKVLGHTRIYNR